MARFPLLLTTSVARVWLPVKQTASPDFSGHDAGCAPKARGFLQLGLSESPQLMQMLNEGYRSESLLEVMGGA